MLYYLENNDKKKVFTCLVQMQIFPTIFSLHLVKSVDA
jgi:hypothetical protein